MNDSEFNHVEFLGAILERYSLQIVVPPVSDPEYVRLIVESFKEEDAAHSLLAMSMTAQLIDHCRSSTDYTPLLSLSDDIEQAVRSGSEDPNVEVTTQELRSALFWGYLRTGQADVRLLRCACRLFSALSGCNYESALKADAALSQGYRQLISDPNGG
jgi:hypothetical protein